MKLTTTFRRHYLIIEFIRRRKRVTLAELLNYLHDHRMKLVERTLQRDIEGIRSEYQIDILYNTSEKKYSINEDSVLPIDDFLHFLEVVNFSELMIESLSDVKDTFRYIQFENTESLKGIHQLKDILFAIRNKRVLNFKHENFWRGTISAISIKPLLIKEYQKRWYVVGAIAGDELRTYGVDRISELEVTEKVFKEKKEWNATDKFSRVIGITYEGERSEVILSFEPFQGKYIKTLPLHTSQQVLVDNKDEYRISLDVIINHELIQRILMYGENVEVIAPLSLRKEIKRVLTESLAFYKKL